MKKYLYLLLIPLFLTGCLKEENGDMERKIKLKVLSETVFRDDTSFPFHKDKEKREFLQVIKENSAEVQFFYLTEIKGFEYQKGYEYQLLVNEKVLANPPQDGGDTEYSLIKILSKTKK